MSVAKTIEILKNTGLFSAVPEKALEKAISENSYSCRFLSSGEKAIIKNALVVVVSGTLIALKSEGTREVYLRKISAGEITGIATLFDTKEQYISTLVAKKDSELLVISEKVIGTLIAQEPEFAEKFTVMLCEKIRYLNGKIDTYTQTSAEERLVEFIRHSANSRGNYPCIEMSMSSLSSALGVGRASLYRVLSSLEQKGMISKEGKKIYLLEEV